MANSVYQDKMAHLDLHCLHKNLSWSAGLKAYTLYLGLRCLPMSLLWDARLKWVKSLSNKVDLIESELRNFNAICLTETCLHRRTSDEMIK